jgi:hypothetical protein
VNFFASQPCRPVESPGGLLTRTLRGTNLPPDGKSYKREQRVGFVKSGSMRKKVNGLVTLGAASVVVVSFMGAPSAAGASPAAAMSHISKTYAHVGRAPRLPSGARTIGAVSASKSINGSVALAPRNASALAKAAAAVAEPKSPSFHHYLSKGAFAAAYGPSAATVNAVESTLRASHLTVTSVSANHLLVHFKGTVGSAESAFRTHIANVRLASGRVGTETTSAVSFPSSLASSVLSVVGLNTLGLLHTHVLRPTHPASVKPVTHNFVHPANSATPCAAATGAATEFGGLTDDQIAHSYGADGLYSQGDFGAGQTVAIYELEPFDISDIKAFDSCYFGPAKATTMTDNVSTEVIDGGAGTGPGSGESALDIENVSAIAPAAKIKVYEAPNGNAGPLDLYNQIVQDDTAKVVSTSWGECEALQQSTAPGYGNVENELFEQAALQGQSIFSSAGDSGSDDCSAAPTTVTPLLSTDDPSSQPFVTAVGGTTITNASDTPTEHVWNDGNTFGGAGGGVSSIWGAPSWQQPFLDTASAAAAVASGDLAACPQSATHGATCREVPDVSAQADEFTGAITVFLSEFGGWLTFGGTSSSAPLWAAMTADINASSGCTASGGVGFASPSLYAVAAIPADYQASFNDLTTGDGNNDVYDINSGTTYATKTGYDMASGLGTPKLTSPTGKAGLASFMCALAAPTASPRPAVSSVLPRSTVLTGTPGPITIVGTGFTGAKALSIGGYAVPAGDWSVTDATHISVTTVPTGSQALTGSFGPQDGSGRALISVTGSTGATSLVSPAAALLYVDTSATSPAPSVGGVVAFGGPKAGGNKVSVFGAGFSSGPVTVKIGGVAATNVQVVNDNELTVTVPAFTVGTVCATAADPATDVCQAQVVVTNANGSSATSTIRLPYTGAIFVDGTTGGASLPACAGTTCEVFPATTEYDYYAAPTISSIVTTSAADPTVYASEQGDTIATINGSGFDSLGFLLTIDGTPSLAANQDGATLTLTPTQIQVMINPHNETHEAIGANLRVQTLAGISNPAGFKWAGVPVVSTISTSPEVNLGGGIVIPVSPVTGGASITVNGRGYLGSLPADGGSVQFQNLGEFGGTSTMNSGYSATDTVLTGTTSSSNAGAAVTTVCTITGCSEPNTESQFNGSLIDFVQKGDPAVTSVTPKSGPASGGTNVAIHGTNLSDTVAVIFGKVPVEAESVPGILTNGSSTEIDLVAPPGRAGSTVSVQVVTIESLYNGHPSAKTSVARFTYKSSVASAPQDVTGTAHGKSLTAHWKAPASNGGHAITRYRVSAVAFANSPSKGAKKPPTVVVVTKHGSARSAKLIGLRAGWTYEIRVQAVNSKGRGVAGVSERVFFIHDPA